MARICRLQLRCISTSACLTIDIRARLEESLFVSGRRCKSTHISLHKSLDTFRTISRNEAIVCNRCIPFWIFGALVALLSKLLKNCLKTTISHCNRMKNDAIGTQTWSFPNDSVLNAKSQTRSLSNDTSACNSRDWPAGLTVKHFALSFCVINNNVYNKLLCCS